MLDVDRSTLVEGSFSETSLGGGAREDDDEPLMDEDCRYDLKISVI